MRSLKNIFLLGSFVTVLAGCYEDHSASYFLKHPARLEAEVTRCQGLNPVARSEDRVCDIAINTAQQVSELVNEWRAQPEAFGQKILKAQLALVEAKALTKHLSQKVDSLQGQDDALLNQASRALQAANESLQAKQDEVNAMMIVVGLASPE